MASPASPGSQASCHVNLYFVVLNKYESNDDCNEDMWHVFNKCCDNDLEPSWITENQCMQLTPGKKDVFVMEEFGGDTFKYLETFKCSIVGPRCLLICFLNAEPIPEGNSPIFTTAMRGLVICASGLAPEEKDEIEQVVKYMGGIYTKNLRSSVTHLITNSVMSAKYEKAIEMKIPIMTEKWVRAVWDVNLKDFVKADDGIFDKYKCPVFRNLVVTATNLSKQEKDEIKCLIDENGGIYMGPLDSLKVKVVLAPREPTLSDKLKYAMENNIACLRTEWVFKSIKVGYALPFENFLIKSTKACSTPKKVQAHETLSISSISTIHGDGHQNNFIDESAMSTVSMVSLNHSTGDSSNAEYIRILDRLALGDAKMAGPFLDGCCIYLAGFTSTQRDKINRILNVGSATRLNDISEALTHVLVGDGNKAYSDLKLIEANRLGPFVLNLKWLEESIKLKRPAPEERFLYEAAPSNGQPKIAEPPSPLSKKNLQMLQKVKKPAIPSFLLDTHEPPARDTNESDLVQQYLQKAVVPDKSMQEILQVRPSMSELKNDGDKSSARDSVDAGVDADGNMQKAQVTETAGRSRSSVNDSVVPISQGLVSPNTKLFQGLTFIVTGFTEDERRNVISGITSTGGRVVSSTFSGIPDFGVVPVCGAPLKHTVNEIVTNLYIDDCLLQEQVVDLEYYHRPLSINKNSKPLSNCVITMSIYTGTERLFLSALATELGARCQAMFARKRNGKKETYANTHLLCPSPEGNKYSAAVKWKLPAVTAEWLLECAAQTKYISETPFLVGETIAPEKAESSGIVEANSSISVTDKRESSAAVCLQSNIVTPTRHFAQNQERPECETPLIDKRLSLVMNKTPQSPFHVATPDTPYGQIFKPNPSPATRKGWLEYIDNLLDIRVEEPPVKRRLPSTPMSELKRRFWEEVKKPINKTQGTAVQSVGDDPFDDETANTTHKTDDIKENNEAADKSPIKRRLDFPDDDNDDDDNDDHDDDNPLAGDEIKQQIIQLQEAFQRTSTTLECRPFPSGDYAKRYYTLKGSCMDSPDHIPEYLGKDSQRVSVGWGEPVYPAHQTSSAPLMDQHNESDDNHVSGEVDGITKQETIPRESTPPPKPKFMLSGIKDKSCYEEAIRQLGGDVSTEANFDSSATHLLCFRPSRNEKMLASIAAGKWVLHFLYLQESEKAGKFLQEDKYEWGNPRSKGLIPEAEGPTEKAIAAAAYKWRLKLSKEPGGAFEGMVALLLVSSQKYDQFKRLIEAGGGSVVQAKPPYDTSPGRRITHCFVAQVQQQADWAMMASKNILCFPPQYLCDYLTAESSLNPRECVISDFKKYLTLLPR